MISQNTQKLINQLKKNELPLEDRTALTTAILGKLAALPLQDSIVIGNGVVSINGRPLEVDQLHLFSESCAVLKDNWARKVLREQVRYLAITGGIMKSTTLEELMFYKAALWCLNQEDELIDKII